MKEDNIKILFDTNVIIDAFTKRENYDVASSNLFFRALRNEINGFVATKQITDIYYILRRYITDKDKRKELINIIIESLYLIDLNKEYIWASKDYQGIDFEDNVLLTIAYNEKMDYLVTNNKKHFVNNKVKIVTPSELEIILNKTN